MKTTFSSVLICALCILVPFCVTAVEPAASADGVLPLGDDFARKLNIPPAEKTPAGSQRTLGDLLSDTDEILKEAAGVKLLFNRDREPNNRDSDALPNLPIKLARINVLNKITAKSESLLLETGVEKRYGSLHLKLYDCANAKPPKRPDSMVLLEVSESSRQDFVEMSLSAQEIRVGKKIFFGWMFASSPAVSSLEHPVYDITVQNCGQ